MSNFFNAHEVVPDTGIDPVPAGQYPVTVAGTGKKELKDGKGHKLDILYQIAAGELAGRKFSIGYNIWNNVSTENTRIAMAQLSALCHCVGVFTLSDTLPDDKKGSELLGKQLIVVVTNDGKYNNVTAHLDVNGNKPLSAGAGAPAPTTAPVATATPGAPAAGWGAPPAAPAAPVASAAQPQYAAPPAPTPTAPANPPAAPSPQGWNQAAPAAAPAGPWGAPPAPAAA